MLIDFATSPITELLAVVTFIVYVVLSARGNIWCWASGFITAFLYTFIFLGIQFTTQVVLNIFYMVIAAWGWMIWSEDTPRDGKSVFGYWQLHVHVLLLIPLVLCGVLAGFLLKSSFHEQLPYLDATITVFSVYATILTVYRRIESWIFWIVLNAMTFYIYYDTGLNQTAALALVNVLLSMYGFSNWRKLRAVDLTEQLLAKS